MCQIQVFCLKFNDILYLAPYLNLIFFKNTMKEITTFLSSTYMYQQKKSKNWEILGQKKLKIAFRVLHNSALIKLFGKSINTSQMET